MNKDFCPHTPANVEPDSAPAPIRTGNLLIRSQEAQKRDVTSLASPRRPQPHSVGEGKSDKNRTNDTEFGLFADRAAAVLGAAFGGMHNVPGKVKKDPMPYWEVHVAATLSTYDFDNLTRLVVAAHDQCIRVELSGSGPRRIKVRLHPRKGREGMMYERHPTIEDAISRMRPKRVEARP